MYNIYGLYVGGGRYELSRYKGIILLVDNGFIFFYKIKKFIRNMIYFNRIIENLNFIFI